MTLQDEIEAKVAEFEKEFVLRPFEPDGDYSFKNLTPYQLKSFLSTALQDIASKTIEAVRVERQSDNPKDYKVVEDYGMALGHNSALEEIELKIKVYYEKN